MRTGHWRSWPSSSRYIGTIPSDLPRSSVALLSPQRAGDRAIFATNRQVLLFVCVFSLRPSSPSAGSNPDCTPVTSYINQQLTREKANRFFMTFGRRRERQAHRFHQSTAQCCPLGSRPYGRHSSTATQRPRQGRRAGIASSRSNLFQPDTGLNQLPCCRQSQIFQIFSR